MTGLLSRWREVLMGLAQALLLHAGWDAAHHGGRISRGVPGWYPSFCAAADLILAGLYAGVHRGP